MALFCGKNSEDPSSTSEVISCNAWPTLCSIAELIRQWYLCVCVSVNQCVMHCNRWTLRFVIVHVATYLATLIIIPKLGYPDLAELAS